MEEVVKYNNSGSEAIPFNIYIKQTNMIGIYKITNPNNKIYIGQSTNIENRFMIYEKYLYNCKSQTKLYNSLKKYGWENHKKEIIEECAENQLLERETYWKLFYKVLETPSLCCRIDGKGGKNSKETNNKIKQHKLENPMSQETKDKISKANINKIYSLESKQKISQSKKGHDCYNNPQWRKNISTSLKNMDEQKRLDRAKKISNKTKGKPKPEGFSNKISKQVLQYDLNGNFIKEWSSVKEAELYYFNKSNDSIGSCCRGKFKQVKNFKWKFKN